MPGIVVGVEGSAGSLKALEWAAREAAIRQAPLTVVTVHPVAASFWTDTVIIYAEDEPVLQHDVQAAREATEKVISELDGPHPTDVAVRGVSGIVVPELLSASQDADLLVLGARGGGGFHALRLGGVSSQLVGHASCPVAVVPA